MAEQVRVSKHPHAQVQAQEGTEASCQPTLHACLMEPSGPCSHEDLAGAWRLTFGSCCSSRASCSDFSMSACSAFPQSSFPLLLAGWNQKKQKDYVALEKCQQSRLLKSPSERLLGQEWEWREAVEALHFIPTVTVGFCHQSISHLFQTRSWDSPFQKIPFPMVLSYSNRFLVFLTSVWGDFLPTVSLKGRSQILFCPFLGENLHPWPPVSSGASLSDTLGLPPHSFPSEAAARLTD